LIFPTPYKKRSDADLVALISKGDSGAFREILTRYQHAVYGFAFSFLKDAQEAEDISQEIFLRLYRTAESYRSVAALQTYLFRITRNLCIDHLRKKRPEAMTNPPESVNAKTPLNQICAAELKNQINLVLSELPENQRAAIYLRHEQGMDYREIAATLGVTRHAVESLLTRARKAFRKKFKF
jgi:RNA polymerase sigma-70 factor (ECF subfamily)